MGTDGDETEHESSAAESQEESMLSFRGLGKGYRFFKTKIYTIRIFIKDNGEVHTAYCICPAGPAGTCNHIPGLLYVLEEFVRLG